MTRRKRWVRAFITRGLSIKLDQSFNKLIGNLLSNLCTINQQLFSLLC
jgi:hypothetical protein